jgi:hypothetical protein
MQLYVNFMSHNKHTNLLFLYFQLGEGSKKCIRYWPDDEISHEHIHVRYIQSESCPYYTRRELNVANTKVSLIIDVGCAQITTHILPHCFKNGMKNRHLHSLPWYKHWCTLVMLLCSETEAHDSHNSNKLTNQMQQFHKFIT